MDGPSGERIRDGGSEKDQVEGEKADEKERQTEFTTHLDIIACPCVTKLIVAARTSLN